MGNELHILQDLCYVSLYRGARTPAFLGELMHYRFNSPKIKVPLLFGAPLIWNWFVWICLLGDFVVLLLIHWIFINIGLFGIKLWQKH